MPQYWVAAHLNHWLWFKVRLFRNAGSKATRQYHSLHFSKPPYAFAIVYVSSRAKNVCKGELNNFTSNICKVPSGNWYTRGLRLIRVLVTAILRRRGILRGLPFKPELMVQTIAGGEIILCHGKTPDGKK